MASTLEVLVRNLSENLVTVSVAGKIVQKIGLYIEPLLTEASSGKSDHPKPEEEKNTERFNTQNLECFGSYASTIIVAAKTRHQKADLFGSVISGIAQLSTHFPMMRFS